MSEARRSQKATSDFSIERILADEETGARRAKSSENATKKRLVSEFYSRCGECECFRDDVVQAKDVLESTRISHDEFERKKCQDLASTDLSNLSWVHCTR